MAFDRLQCSDTIFYEDMIDHHSYVHNLRCYEIKAWKTSGLNEIQTHNLCDTGTVLYCNGLSPSTRPWMIPVQLVPMCERYKGLFLATSSLVSTLQRTWHRDYM